MNFFKFLSILSIAAMALPGCTDENPDKSGPTIEITNIPDNKEYKFGDPLVMNFKFTDQTGMYEYKYEIYAEDFTPQSFQKEEYVTYENASFREKTETKIVQLPEKTPSVTYQEGVYLIKVQASDVNQRMTTYYKPIKITYPVE